MQRQTLLQELGGPLRVALVARDGARVHAGDGLRLRRRGSGMRGGLHQLHAVGGLGQVHAGVFQRPAHGTGWADGVGVRRGHVKGV